MRNPKSVLDNLELIKGSDRNVILFGSLGVGKTTLLNKICGKNFPTENSGYSCTRDAQFARSLRGNNLIIDFPGLNTVIDFVKHLKTQQTVLSTIPVRLICFVIKYGPRYDDIIMDFNQMFQIFKNYKNNITIIITNTENLKIKNREDIKFIFEKKYNIKNILFTNINTNPKEINEQINSEVEKTKKIENRIDIPNDLSRAFISPNMSKFQFDIFEKRNEYSEKFREAIKKFKKEFDNIEKKKIALYSALKEYQENLKDKFVEELKKRLNEEEIMGDDLVYDINLQLILFNNESSENLKDVKNLLERKTLISEITIFTDPEITIKKCYNCGQIWIRDSECENVKCGRTLTDKEFEENKQRDKQNKILIKPIGCGILLKWSECKDATEELKSILKI